MIPPEVAVELPARSAVHAPWPTWLSPEVIARWSEIIKPWLHQVQVAEAAHADQHVVVATGTASGKSLGYAMPIAEALAEHGGTALYLSPTKALAADQLAAWQEWNLPGVRAATVDGDTPAEDRMWARKYANLILTNPDMLHASLLPDHARWARFWRSLRYVVIDEAHIYRGVFGSHVGLILRRLQRIAAKYQANTDSPGPVFIIASATMGDPATFGSRLIGSEVVVIDEDHSPSPPRTVVLRTPPADPEGEPQSAVAFAADYLADLVEADVRTLAFVRSRRAVEYAATRARERNGNPRIAGYRGGYLPEERRELEKALREGDITGMVATSALELGIDISGLDAVITAGWPGTRASLWQQFGRAGRGTTPSQAVFIAREDPLDQYVVEHPETVIGASVETPVCDPANPAILGPQLCCAAMELPITEDELNRVFPANARNVLDQLCADHLLRRRPTGWYWTDRQRPHSVVDIRGTGGPVVRVVESDTGRLLGTVDSGAAHRQVHEGAVYVHLGTSYVIEELNLEDAVAFAREEEVDYTTFARDISDIRILETQRSVELAGGITMNLGIVEVSSQTVSFQKRRIDGENLGEMPLSLPERLLRTVAVWWTLPPDWITKPKTPGAVHAAEHAAIGLLPLFATCDRWDIGGVSTAAHPDTATTTIFIYDGFSGGAGFSAHGFNVAAEWLAATRDLVRACSCTSGCPACIQSPKCGNGNEPLDKAGAIEVLTVLHQAVAAQPETLQSVEPQAGA